MTNRYLRSARTNAVAGPMPHLAAAQHLDLELSWEQVLGCVVAHTLRSTHSPTALRSVEEVVTVLQFVNQVRTLTDAEQWLVVAAVALLVVAFTGYVGLAVCLVARGVVSIGRRADAWRRSGSRS